MKPRPFSTPYGSGCCLEEEDGVSIVDVRIDLFEEDPRVVRSVISKLERYAEWLDECKAQKKASRKK